MKDVYRSPSLAALATDLTAAAALAALTADPSNDLAGQFATILAEILGTEQVAVDAHFFDDLGADSLTMTKFCSQVAQAPDLPTSR